MKRTRIKRSGKPMNRNTKNAKAFASGKVKKKSHPDKVKADALWSKYIRARDKDTCQYCGAVKGGISPSGNLIVVQAHHIITRESYRIRHDPENGITLCKGCHKFQAHGTGQVDFNDFIQTKWLGEKRWEALKQTHLIKTGKADYKLAIIYLQQLIKELV